MSCFHCLFCCKSSKNSNVQLRNREGSSGCYCCKGSEEGNDIKRVGSGIERLRCDESSSSKDDSQEKNCCFPCKKSLKKDTKTRREEKGKKCFACFKSSQEEGKKRKRRKCKIGSLCCYNSSSNDDSLKSKGCCCFPSQKSSKDTESIGEEKDKKCCSCFRSPREKRERKRSGHGIGCLCCKESSAQNDSAERRGCCCLSNKKSSKEDIESRGEEKNKNCFSCFRQSKEEGKERNNRGCGITRFCCGKSLLKDESSKVRDCCCLSPNNSSNENSEFRAAKDKSCFPCFRSSKEDSSNNRKSGAWSYLYCCDNKLSKDDSSKKEGKTIVCCLPCCVGKSSKENSFKKGEGFCFQCCRGKSLKEPYHEETVSEKNKLNKDSAKKRGSNLMCCCGFCCTKSVDERKQISETKCTLSCFCCIQSESYQNTSLKKRKGTLSCLQMKDQPQVGNHLATTMHTLSIKSDYDGKDISQAKEILPSANDDGLVQVFAYEELVAATKNFSEDCILGSGGAGKVYKGELQEKNEVVAIKQLKRNANQGSNELLVDVVMLSLIRHPNLVELHGYCAVDDQIILVYEYMPFGSLHNHLLDIVPNDIPLDWFTRMKIAAGAAKGLEYLHDVVNPPIIYRDMKASNILLDENYNPKLSDFGLEKPTRVMGTYGCYAPEYAFTRQLTKTTDVYSFGILLLELITGRKAIDIARTKNEQYLAHWAAPLFKDRRKYPRMADPLLNGNYPIKGLYQALAIANMCLQYEASSRPLMSDVVTAIEYLVKPEIDCSEPLEKPSLPHQSMPSNHENLKFEQIPCNSRRRTSTRSLDDECFQSLSSEIESCGNLREEGEQVEA
ncbi:hypothetical protein IEQ34_016302 [Dendrobium chrysotoxum]|uniref:Protein kinase domain-containing protein n=1 Tax=Dendrobium chrysotoxum TaxID=161865 RepID=A0AAV7GF67_DENCH|nr:hypothetical protein IEQ34_016302 [Dendrobium chrysotoxum]